MAWVTITEANLLTRISGPELSAIRAAALGAGQADPVAETIKNTVMYVRGRVAACKQNTLGAGQTIPEELMQQALALIVVAFMDRAAGLMIDANGQRKRDAERAEEILKDVAACEFAVEQPATPSTQVISSPEPSISANEPGFTRDEQDGV